MFRLIMLLLIVSRVGSNSNSFTAQGIGNPRADQVRDSMPLVVRLMMGMGARMGDR